jgi:hypothetical protein
MICSHCGFDKDRNFVLEAELAALKVKYESLKEYCEELEAGL